MTSGYSGYIRRGCWERVATIWDSIFASIWAARSSKYLKYKTNLVSNVLHEFGTFGQRTPEYRHPPLKLDSENVINRQ